MFKQVWSPNETPFPFNLQPKNPLQKQIIAIGLQLIPTNAQPSNTKAKIITKCHFPKTNKKHCFACKWK
jgi:hypothetical protein